MSIPAWVNFIALGSPFPVGVGLGEQQDQVYVSLMTRQEIYYPSSQASKSETFTNPKGEIQSHLSLT